MVRWSSQTTLVLISLASLGWAVSFGLLASLAPVTLEDADLSATTIGLNTSLYYLGVAIASPFVPWFMNRARSCVVMGMLMDALTTVFFPLAGDALTWHLLRFIGGVGTALSLIPMETLVNAQSSPSERASRFGIYAFCVALGLAIGSASGLPLMPYSETLPYFLAGGITLLATGLAWVGMPLAVAGEETGGSERYDWVRERYGFATGMVQGFLEGGTFAFLTLYLLGRGITESFAGLLLGALFAGVVVAQLPLCWLADRWGLTRSVTACLMLLLVGLLVVPWSPFTLLIPLLFMLGACCGALYPLGLALLGERVPTAQLARANAYYLAANCAGSLAGPLVIGLAVEWLGFSALFSVGAVAVMLVLASATASPSRRQPAPPVVSATRQVA